MLTRIASSIASRHLSFLHSLQSGLLSMPIPVPRSRESSPFDRDAAVKRIKLDVSGAEPDFQALVRQCMNSPVQYTKTYQHELDYREKLVLAPMVRTGSCECRLWSVTDQNSAYGMSAVELP